MPKAVLVIDMPERCTKCPLLLTIPQKGGLALCLADQRTDRKNIIRRMKKHGDQIGVHSLGTAGEDTGT